MPGRRSERMASVCSSADKSWQEITDVQIDHVHRRICGRARGYGEGRAPYVRVLRHELHSADLWVAEESMGDAGRRLDDVFIRRGGSGHAKSYRATIDIAGDSAIGVRRAVVAIEHRLVGRLDLCA